MDFNSDFCYNVIIWAKSSLPSWLDVQLEVQRKIYIFCFSVPFFFFTNYSRKKKRLIVHLSNSWMCSRWWERKPHSTKAWFDILLKGSVEIRFLITFSRYVTGWGSKNSRGRIHIFVVACIQNAASCLISLTGVSSKSSPWRSWGETLGTDVTLFSAITWKNKITLKKIYAFDSYISGQVLELWYHPHIH